MRKAVQLFEQDFARWNLHLPADAVDGRRGGQLREAGWSIRFNFGCDGGGEYLDYYASPRDVRDDPPGDDWHVRLYESGERMEMPPVLEAYLYGRDPSWEELERARQPFERPGGLARSEETSPDDTGGIDVPADAAIVEHAGVESADVESTTSEQEPPSPPWSDAPDPLAEPFLASSSADIAYLPLDIGLDVELSLTVEAPKVEPPKVEPTKVEPPRVEPPRNESTEADAVEVSPSTALDEIRPELEPAADVETAPLELPRPEALSTEIGIESTDDESFAAWLASPVTASEHGDATQAPDAAPGLLRSDTEFSLDRLDGISDGEAAPAGSLSLSRPEPRAPIESIEVSDLEPIAPPPESGPAEIEPSPAAGHTEIDVEPTAAPAPEPKAAPVLADAPESAPANPWENIDEAPAPEPEDSTPAAKAVSRPLPEPRSQDRTGREGPSVTGPGRRSRGMVIERAFGGTPLGLQSITDAEILQPWWSRASNRRLVMGIAAAVLMAIAVTTYLGFRSSHAHRSASQPDDAAAMDSGASSSPEDTAKADPATSPDTLATPSHTPIGPDSVADSRPPTDSAAPERPAAEEPAPERSAAAQEEAVARPAGPGSVSPIISSRRPGKSLLRH